MSKFLALNLILNFIKFQYLEHEIFCFTKIKFILHVLYVNTNITMQYGEPVPQGKCNSSLEVVTFPLINVSGHNCNIMNTLHKFVAKLTQS